MSTSQPPERASGGAKQKPCPKCGQPMRLTSVEPHHQFTNLDIRQFVAIAAARSATSCSAL